MGGGLHGERAGQDGKCGILAEGLGGAGADRRYSGRAAAYGTRAASDAAGCWRAWPSGGPAVAGSPPAPRSLPAQHARPRRAAAAAHRETPHLQRRGVGAIIRWLARRARRIVQPATGTATPPEAR
ncbi:histidine kinase [Burkholderia multivorans]|uniref:Histidine kinase n=1 Tax=Burkholderia multivorans TaxID=87883 RepID=A0A2S9MQ51_9BURK|nr:histidine kinase [Burkholderia multivorans]PRF02993.1 histidine kinase [Burkholderia multivorans]PRF60909.1 histidine kinase [Burkholderia multivorans]